MKDLSGLTYSFQEWSALLDFLANLTQTKARDIHIARKDDKEWTMTIKEDRVTNHKRTSRGAALYDLCW